MKKIISIIFITVILNSCGSVSNFFGGEDIDKDRIQGDRISILSLEFAFLILFISFSTRALLWPRI